MIERGFIALVFTSLVFALVFNVTNYLIALVSKFWNMYSVADLLYNLVAQEKHCGEKKHCDVAESKINSDWEQKKKEQHHNMAEEYLASIDERLKAFDKIEELSKMPYVN